MNIERFPWLNDAIRAHQKITFPSSSIIEGEPGLAKKQLAKYFAQKLLCSDISAPCGICNSCNYFVAKGDGTHQFSKTYKQHLEAVKKYQLN